MGDNTVLEFGEHLFNSRLTNDNVKLNSVSLRYCDTDCPVIRKNVKPIIVIDMSACDYFNNTCRLLLNSNVKILNPDIYRNVGDVNNKDVLITIVYGFMASDKFGNKYLYGVSDVDDDLLSKFEKMVSDTIVTAYGFLGKAHVGFEYKYNVSELLSRSEYNYRISHMYGK